MDSIPLWLQAGFWGLLAGSALLLGAAAGYWLPIPRRLIAAIMAFGAGALVSSLAFELMDEALRIGGLGASAIGFMGGAALYTAANRLLATAGAKHRKRSGDQQPSERDDSGSGLAIAVGALLDGIPESIVIGLGLIHGGSVGLAAVVAVFLSNLPDYGAFQDLDGEAIAATTAVAAGAILAMLADTMIPEAFADTQDYAGLITALGFLTALAFSAGMP
ncbi:ZIP family metal transporter [Achromobacter sp.]|uniref:ZIP family metal transporter n=1 Tax=Achromobacter sp. TaxID=134375 RepID=UPI003CFBEC2C